MISAVSYSDIIIISKEQLIFARVASNLYPRSRVAQGEMLSTEAQGSVVFSLCLLKLFCVNCSELLKYNTGSPVPTGCERGLPVKDSTLFISG